MTGGLAAAHLGIGLDRAIFGQQFVVILHWGPLEWTEQSWNLVAEGDQRAFISSQSGVCVVGGIGSVTSLRRKRTSAFGQQPFT